MVLVDDDHSSLSPTTLLFQHCYQQFVHVGVVMDDASAMLL